MLRTFLIIVSIAVFGIIIAFAVVNYDSIVLHYFFGHIEIPLSVLLILGFMVGLICGLLLEIVVVFQQRVTIRKTKKLLEATELELSNLRKMPLKDFSG